MTRIFTPVRTPTENRVRLGEAKRNPKWDIIEMRGAGLAVCHFSSV